MGQHISHCQTGTEPSRGDFEPHTMGEGRKRRLPGATAPKFLLHQDDHTASTGQSSSKTSFSPPSPLGSSSGTTGKPHATRGNASTSHLPHPVALRYTTSTRNLQNPTASATTATTAMPGLRARGATDPATRSALQPPKQPSARVPPGIRNRPTVGAGPQSDKRSNPVKFPRKRNLYGLNAEQRNDATASHHPHGPSPLHELPPDSSYLERMYDSRTWEMYRRITSHREKVEAFNAANAAAHQRDRDHNDDRHSTTNRTYMSDPVQRVTNSTTMEGGVDYDNFYDPGQEDDDADSGGGMFLLEDHSAPPCHRHRQCDNGQHHYTNSDYHHHHHNNNSHNHNNILHPAETYSEWEHMNGDELEAPPGHDATNAHGGQHETIFLFDF